MNCQFNKNGDCKLVIPIICGDKCAYGELLEEFITLQQTYDACYNEHIQTVKQNNLLQAEVKDLEELAECKEKRIRELYDMYHQLVEETKLTS